MKSFSPNYFLITENFPSDSIFSSVPGKAFHSCINFPMPCFYGFAITHEYCHILVCVKWR